MKMYTNESQTAKLIELGFDKPKNIVEGKLYSDTHFAYFIGELIEMLPKVIEDEDCEYATLQMYFDLFNWIVEYTGVDKTVYAVSHIELIDALYDMVIKLKEEGII
jgi:hypothetical protein